MAISLGISKLASNVLRGRWTKTHGFNEANKCTVAKNTPKKLIDYLLDTSNKLKSVSFKSWQPFKVDNAPLLSRKVLNGHFGKNVEDSPKKVATSVVEHISSKINATNIAAGMKNVTNTESFAMKYKEVTPVVVLLNRAGNPKSDILCNPQLVYFSSKSKKPPCPPNPCGPGKKDSKKKPKKTRGRKPLMGYEICKPKLILRNVKSKKSMVKKASKQKKTAKPKKIPKPYMAPEICNPKLVVSKKALPLSKSICKSTKVKQKKSSKPAKSSKPYMAPDICNPKLVVPKAKLEEGCDPEPKKPSKQKKVQMTTNPQLKPYMAYEICTPKLVISPSMCQSSKGASPPKGPCAPKGPPPPKKPSATKTNKICVPIKALCEKKKSDSKPKKLSDLKLKIQPKPKKVNPCASMPMCNPKQTKKSKPSLTQICKSKRNVGISKSMPMCNPRQKKKSKPSLTEICKSLRKPQKTCYSKPKPKPEPKPWKVPCKPKPKNPCGKAEKNPCSPKKSK